MRASTRPKTRTPHTFCLTPGLLSQASFELLIQNIGRKIPERRGTFDKVKMHKDMQVSESLRMLQFVLERPRGRDNAKVTDICERCCSESFVLFFILAISVTRQNICLFVLPEKIPRRKAGERLRTEFRIFAHRNNEQHFRGPFSLFRREKAAEAEQ